LFIAWRTRCTDAITLAVRLERWRIGAEHAGWKFGWRDSLIAGDPGRRLSKPIATPLSAPIFMMAIGAPRGALVYMTPGTVHWVGATTTAA
jgi:hypothetical protein